eukprot:144033-Karenia_brevis.AAC.1
MLLATCARLLVCNNTKLWRTLSSLHPLVRKHLKEERGNLELCDPDSFSRETSRARRQMLEERRMELEGRIRRDGDGGRESEGSRNFSSRDASKIRSRLKHVHDLSKLWFNFSRKFVVRGVIDADDPEG